LTEDVETQSEIADVQSSRDTRQIAINKVGIKDIRHPVKIKDRTGGEQHTVATFNMYVNLPHNFKGTHMSRFVEILNSYEKEIGVESFNGMLHVMADRLEAEAGHIEMNFPYFINKQAPVSEVRSNKGLGDLCQAVVKYPQELINVRLENGVDVMASPVMQEAVRDAESELSDQGRVLLRPSGTEPLIRVMVEGNDQSQVRQLSERLAAVARELVVAG